MSSNLMKGVIDMHVHSNPDLRLRAYDDFELMEAGIRAGARGIVIKTHQGSTQREPICATGTMRESMEAPMTLPCSEALP